MGSNVTGLTRDFDDVAVLEQLTAGGGTGLSFSLGSPAATERSNARAAGAAGDFDDDIPF